MTFGSIHVGANGRVLFCFFFFNVFYFWAWAEEGQRESGTEDPKRALHWQQWVRCGARSHELRDGDLSRSQMFNRLSHPGTLVSFFNDWIIFCCLTMPHFLHPCIHCDSLFCILPVVSNAVANMGLYVPFQLVFLSSDKYWRWSCRITKFGFVL